MQPHSTPAGERRVFQARMSMLPVIAAFVASFCDRHGITHDDALRLTLIVEELFTNSVTYGYGGDSDAPVELTLSVEASDIMLVYADAAPPFDPLSRPPLPSADLVAPPESRSVGGLGVHLARHLVAGARYAREDDRNRLWLTVRRGS
jgi:anti-sigma regulatory factor (Ser/Thr protein kinase)